MFGFIRTALVRYGSSIFGSKASTHSRYLQTLNPDFDDQQSLTVSYLSKSCGLSIDKALKASKLVNIENTKNADSVLELFRNHGFSRIDIEKLISKQPRLISANPDKTLRPKVEYIQSLGISSNALPKILCSISYLLFRSLKDHIIPTFDFLRGFVKTNENVVRILKRSPRLIYGEAQKNMLPNVACLHANGVPAENIMTLIMLRPESLTLKEDLFKEIVEDIKGMGFEPTKSSFILAIRSLSSLSQETQKKRKELLMRLGWSENEFNLAFRVQPMLMLCSERKIMRTIDFFINKVGLKSSDIAKYPNVFLLSLEGRIIPRCSVLKVLMSEGLIEKNGDIFSKGSITKNEPIFWVLIMKTAYFERKFVTPNKENVPLVMKAYKGDIEFEGFS